MEKQSISQDSLEFHLREFESLKKEITVTISEERLLERYIIIGTGIVWVWLLTNQNMDIPRIAWWIPLFFASLGALRSLTLLLSIQRMATYIKLIEQNVQVYPEINGWEHFCEENRMPFISISAGLFWGSAIIATALAPLILA